MKSFLVVFYISTKILKSYCMMHFVAERRTKNEIFVENLRNFCEIFKYRKVESSRRKPVLWQKRINCRYL